MSTKGGLVFLIISIVLVLTCIIGIIGVYYFDWLKLAKPNYTLYTTTSESDARFANNNEPNQNANFISKNEEVAQITQIEAQTTQKDAVINEQYLSTENVVNNKDNFTFYNLENEDNSIKQPENTPVEKKDAVAETVTQPTYTNVKNTEFAIKTTSEQQNSQPTKTEQNNKENTQIVESKTEKKSNVAVANVKNDNVDTSKQKTSNKSTSNPVKPTTVETNATFTKAPAIGKDGSPIKIGFTFDKQRDFHSYGQYISADEYKYRLALINNLKIKTIIIDAVSKGNGISQEYYKVAYNSNMIPAKILDEITTSKEFRNLIPKEYLEIESKLTTFPKNGKISFNNTDIKQLLILWSQGKLTPTQKAWQVNANL